MRTLPRWLSDKIGHRNDPARIVQDALSDTAGMSLQTMTDALDEIVSGVLWREGGPHASFGDFAVALPPAGLGVRSERPAKLLRHALLVGGHFAEWTDVLERVVRRPGRPHKTLANDEGFERFYTVPTAATTRDRLLLALKNLHPEQFAAVCAFECSPREAAIRAGVIKLSPSRYGGACNIVAAAGLPERAQGRLLCDLFKVMSPSAQCTLIARMLEPRLGFGLAQRWRGDEQEKSPG
jgi:hypothetical protein